MKSRTLAAGAGDKKEGARPKVHFHPSPVCGQSPDHPLFLRRWDMAFEAATVVKRL